MPFDALKVKNDIVKWIRDWFQVNGKGCKGVVAVSGGKDSSVVAALLVEALGKENVVGVLLPNGEQFDIDVSNALVEHLGIKSYTININSAYKGIMEELEKNGGSQHTGNGKSSSPFENVNGLCGFPKRQRQSCQHLQSFGRLGGLCHKIR